MSVLIVGEKMCFVCPDHFFSINKTSTITLLLGDRSGKEAGRPDTLVIVTVSRPNSRPSRCLGYFTSWSVALHHVALQLSELDDLLSE